MITKNAVGSASQQLSVADVGMVLGAFVGAIDRYHQYCNRIANAITRIGREANIGAERGFSAVAGAHRLDEIAQEARRHHDAEHGRVERDDSKNAEPKGRPSSLVTATVACSQYSTSKRTLQRAIKDGRLEDFRQQNRASNSPLLVDLQEVAKNWPRRGATK
ncbi:MAG: hypothetical protein JSR52_00860 [Planctomycetes bacterium]|nr:hypothetical protein [Planctomycetota bacterium]